MSKKGSLIVVGTGIKFMGHLTAEAVGHMEAAEVILYAMGDSVSVKWLQEKYPHARPFRYYYDDKPRIEAYREWIEQMLIPVREGKKVCAVFYGHPGVFVYASRMAVRQAREEGYEAAMLPGISAEDCLYADLAIDPAESGIAHFGATDFLLRQRKWDVASALVLWQVCLTGDTGYKEGRCNRKGIKILTDYLIKHYGPEHKIIVYEAAQFAVTEPLTEEITLKELPNHDITILSTLYIPPLYKRNTDKSMAARLKGEK